MERRRLIVAIDGPAGAGKSTVARRLAAALGYTLIDTGAMYRSVALTAMRAGIAFDDHARVATIAERLAHGALVISTDVRSATGDTLVFLDAEDISQAIRTPEVSLGASAVSALNEVRTALLPLQHALGEQGGVVMEGRDIGTVVFPQAQAKFFVTASAHVRARRRFEELSLRGVDVSFEATLREVLLRDDADRTRALAPLVAASDALIIDTSLMSIDDVVQHLVEQVRAIAACPSA